MNSIFRLVVIFGLSCAVFLPVSHAQNTGQKEHTIDSKVFGKERRIRVMLPELYEQDTSIGFIATYVLDAQADAFWNMANGNLEYLVWSYNGLPTIAVGIVSDDRGDEFDPNNPKLRQHLKEEVFPLIEKTYRVKPFRTVIGHSWGGAFVMSTLLGKDRDMFDGYIGISPSFSDTDLMEQADSVFALKPDFRKFLYFSTGDVGSREIKFRENVVGVAELLKKYPNSSLAFEEEVFEGGDHWSCVGPSLTRGYMTMSRNYFADQAVVERFAAEGGDLIAKIKAFEQEKKEKFGYVMPLNAGMYKFLGDEFQARSDYETALTLYNAVISMKPKAVRTHISLCEALRKSGQTAKAIETLKHTKSLAEAQKEDLGEAFYKDVIEYVEMRLKELE
ncbi:MAG: alpha/beta hydrolase-fold protein [Bacteroidota bacterium]